MEKSRLWHIVKYCYLVLGGFFWFYWWHSLFHLWCRCRHRSQWQLCQTHLLVSCRIGCIQFIMCSWDGLKIRHLLAVTSIMFFFVFLTGMTMNLATATVLQICYCTCTPRSNFKVLWPQNRSFLLFNTLISLLKP